MKTQVLSRRIYLQNTSTQEGLMLSKEILSSVQGCIVSPQNSHQLRTYKYGLAWKQGLCRCNLVRMTPYLIKAHLKCSMTGVLIRGKSGHRDTKNRSEGCM